MVALPWIDGAAIGRVGFHCSSCHLHPISDTVAYLTRRGLAIRHRIKSGGWTMTDGRGEAWIEAGIKEIARSGVEGVRVEVLAKNLGVTKGGFYRRFKDRAALLEAILQSWSVGRIAAIEQQTRIDGMGARERLGSLIRLYSEKTNAEGMAVELAIRQWARTDEAAAQAVASVDAARLQNVALLYRATGLSLEEADAQAFLFYCFVFGQSLLFLERGPRRRAQLIARSAEILLDERS
jgi:AcrR family transcriptional regulator